MVNWLYNFCRCCSYNSFNWRCACYCAYWYGVSAKGAVKGTQHFTTISEGQQFDRFGRLTGKYITDVGTPESKLALPSTNTGVKTSLQATRSFQIITGVVADGFGGTGGGTKYVMRYSIKKLIKTGWLVLI